MVVWLILIRLVWFWCLVVWCDWILSLIFWLLVVWVICDLMWKLMVLILFRVVGCWKVVFLLVFWKLVLMLILWCLDCVCFCCVVWWCLLILLWILWWYFWLMGCWCWFWIWFCFCWGYNLDILMWRFWRLMLVGWNCWFSRFVGLLCLLVYYCFVVLLYCCRW